MEVGPASGASVASPDHVTGHEWQGVAATVAGETKVGHGGRPRESSTCAEEAEGVPNRGRRDRNEGHLVSTTEVSESLSTGQTR